MALFLRHGYQKYKVKMKEFGKFFFAAIIGGAVSFAAFKYTEQDTTVKNTLTSQTSDAGTSEGQNKVKPSFATYLPPEAENADFRAAAQSSINAVVHVRTIYESKTRYYTDPFMEYFFGRGTFEQRTPRREGTGSGVIISKDGYIVTNNHVITGGDLVEVTLNNKKVYQAEVVGTDPTTDLALLKVNEDDLPNMPYGNSDNLAIGEWVLAVGNPFNLRSTVTAGIVSAKARDINILKYDREKGLAPIESFIQTDAAVNPGNSGGALVNVSGELVGINTAIQSNTGSYTGYSFAVPVNIVKKVVRDLLEFGTVQRAFIGVGIQPLTKELAEENDLTDLNGIYVGSIADNGAAKEAGLEKGDVIRKIQEVEVKNIPQLQEQLGKYRPGDEISVTVWRNGKELTKKLTLRNQYGEESLYPAPNDEFALSLGAKLEPASDEELEELNIKGGLKVISLHTGKLKRAGIDEGFIITKVDDKNISDYQSFVELLKGKKGGVLIEGFYPNGTKAYYGLGL